MVDIKSIFGGNLKKWRKMRKMSQESLSERLGITPHQLSFIETGRSFASAEVIQNAVCALAVAPFALFYADGEAVLDDGDFEKINSLIDELARLAKSKIHEMRSERRENL